MKKGLASSEYLCIYKKLITLLRQNILHCMLHDVQSTTGHVFKSNSDLLLLHWRHCTVAWCMHTRTCVYVSEPHLKTGNSEATSIIWWWGHRNNERAVGDVLIVETDGNLIVSYGWKELKWESHQTSHTKYKDSTREATTVRSGFLFYATYSHLFLSLLSPGSCTM